MTTIIVASQNPVKIQAAVAGFRRIFHGIDVQAQAVSVPSGVAEQPMSSAETLQGAVNRALNARQAAPQADYWVGIEGGVEPSEDELLAFAWVVVVDGHGRLGKGRTATFLLPRQVAELVHQGKELGEADDIVFGRSNSKQENGAVGILTGDAINRAGLYEQGVVLALIPFFRTEMYSSSGGY